MAEVAKSRLCSHLSDSVTGNSALFDLCPIKTNESLITHWFFDFIYHLIFDAALL